MEFKKINFIKLLKKHPVLLTYFILLIIAFIYNLMYSNHYSSLPLVLLTFPFSFLIMTFAENHKEIIHLSETTIFLISSGIGAVMIFFIEKLFIHLYHLILVVFLLFKKSQTN